MKFATKAIHAGIEPDESTGAIMTPIYQTSTYVQEEVGKHKGYAYSRSKNPTRSALESSLAALENGKFGACFGSGLAAIDCVLKMLSPGDEVISTNDLYGGTYRIFSTIFERFGIKFHYTSMDEPAKVKALMNEKTRLVWVETPTNPTLKVIDIEKLASLTKETNVLLAVDNTFSTPYVQRPLELGADIVMHSITKYIGGHSDIVMGALVTSNSDLADEMYRIQNASGAICGPQDAFLALRGIKTLHLRMQRHCENGMAVAEHLQKNPAVANVFYAGLPDHPNHGVARKQMNGFTGMVSFDLKNDSAENAHRVLKRFRLFALAESLGGVESLAGHPATMTHASIPVDVRRLSGISDSLIRLSVGVEDIDDLLFDLDQALA
ncbi:MAG: PLP-dependent aspartate aminotransferase family protein [Flavobacteriales bacterium]|nr:PLP-dependent aspartate aminotransferase family protein [Flavobacteriales bacterium]